MGNGLSDTELPAFKRKPGWDGAIGIAKNYHQQYVNSLDEWGEFQKEHGDKVRLWQMTRQILKKSVTTDGISTSHLCDALGVSYRYENADDVDDEKWIFEEWLYASLNLGFDSSLSELADKAGTVNDDFSSDNEFIRFGRELVTRRAAVELSANKLIRFMKYGVVKDQSPLPLSKTGIAEKDDPKLNANNAFYTDFITYDLDEQIIIAKELTYGLGKSQRGKDFLANLFEFRHLSIFDPFGFVRVLYYKAGEDKFYSGQHAIDRAKRGYLSVFCKDLDGYQKKYLTDDGRYKLEDNPDIQTDSVVEHLTQLLTQLYAGLIHFHATRTNNSIYMDGVTDGRTAPSGGTGAPNPDPDAIVSEFTGRVLSLFVNDDQMRSIIGDIDWSETAHDEPDWSSDNLDDIQGDGDHSWGDSETKAIAAITAAKANSFTGAMNVPGWAGPFNVLFSTMGAAAGISSLFDPGNTSAKEQIKNLRSVGKGVTSLSTFEQYLPEEYADEIADINTGAKLVNMGRKAAKYLGVAGMVLDGLYVILNAYEMACQMSRGDYDAAGGYALLGLGGAASVGAAGAGLVASGSGIGFATSATLGLVSGGLITIALVLAGLGSAVVAWCDESEITEWIRYTRFGTGWSELSKYNILNPNAQTFGYRNFVHGSEGPLGEPNFSQQISSLHTLVRPIGLSTVRLGSASRKEHSGKNSFGELTFKPYENGEWDSKSEVEILEGGLLFVRPLPILGESGATMEYTLTDDITDEYLHRISLRDGPDTTDLDSKVSAGTASEWKTSLGEHEPNPFLEALEEYTETEYLAGDLDLDITDVSKTTNDHGERPVVNWDGTFWDMAGNGSRIFGWTFDQISPSDNIGTQSRRRYVEVLYVPPEVADSMQNNPAEIRPKDIPAVSRERMMIGYTTGGPTQ